VKYSVLLGRGLEGCGVTRCAIEFLKVHPGTRAFATVDKKWGRRDPDAFPGEEFMCGDAGAAQIVLESINETDVCFIFSVPSKGHPEMCQINFLSMLDLIKAKKVMLHFDHSNNALHKNANIEKVVPKMDLVMSHSKHGAMAIWMENNSVKVPFKELGLGFDFDGYRKKYWKPIEKTDPKEVRWIGRTAAWKGPKLILDLHDNELRSYGYRTILEGLEASINYVQVCYHDDFEKTRPREIHCHFRTTCDVCGSKQETLHGREKYGDPAYCYPPYIHDECMERLSTSAFASDLYHLSAEKYGRNIENCHAEVVAVGSIPIFHKHFGDNVLHRELDVPMTSALNSGTIWLDNQNIREVGETIRRLSADPIERDDWREAAFNFWKSHADATMIYKKMVEEAVEPLKKEVELF
jgi:hypothetical protein